MNTSCFTFNVAPSDPSKPLGIELWANDQLVVDHEQITEITTVRFDFNDDEEKEYQLKIVVKNKSTDYTIVDDQGQIVSDSTITISNFNLDNIDLEQIVQKQAVYTHDFNGSQPEIKDQFFGTAGCNGTIEMGFASPVYLWLLGNM